MGREVLVHGVNREGRAAESASYGFRSSPFRFLLRFESEGLQRHASHRQRSKKASRHCARTEVRNGETRYLCAQQVQGNIADKLFGEVFDRIELFEAFSDAVSVTTSAKTVVGSF